MNDITQPIASSKNLVKATVAAIVLASAVLLLIVLPAEYNIDPTGFGKTVGLTRLSQSSQENLNSEVVIQSSKEQQNSLTIEVAAGSGIEYKFHLEQYGKIEYFWKTDGGVLYFDFHGEPEGDTTGYFESYTISTSDEMRGSMTVPFAGSHGWYWRNDSSNVINITLSTKGNYTVIGVPGQ